MLLIYNKAFYFFEDRLALACTNLFTYNLCISHYFIQALAKMFTSLMERYYIQILLDTESRFLCHPHRRDRLFCFNFSLKPLLTVCYYHVTYAYQSDFTVYSCPKFKELFARNRRDIWNLSDSSAIRTHSHLLRKQTPSHGWAFVYKLSDRGLESRCCHLELLPLNKGSSCTNL